MDSSDDSVIGRTVVVYDIPAAPMVAIVGDLVGGEDCFVLLKCITHDDDDGECRMMMMIIRLRTLEFNDVLQEKRVVTVVDLQVTFENVVCRVNASEGCVFRSLRRTKEEATEHGGRRG